MYQNVPIELIERIEALERRMEKNWEGDPLQPPPLWGGFADIADKLFKKNSLRRVQNRGAKVGVFFNVNVNVFVGKANGVQSPRRALSDAAQVSVVGGISCIGAAVRLPWRVPRICSLYRAALPRRASATGSTMRSMSKSTSEHPTYAYNAYTLPAVFLTYLRNK